MVNSDVELKVIPDLNLVEGWQFRRKGRDRAELCHMSGIKFNIALSDGAYVVTSNTYKDKVVKLATADELNRFLFKMMCLIDDYKV